MYIWLNTILQGGVLTPETPPCVPLCFYYERRLEYSLFLLMIFFFALPLSAERSKKINKTKNTSFHAGSGNGPLSYVI